MELRWGARALAHCPKYNTSRTAPIAHGTDRKKSRAGDFCQIVYSLLLHRGSRIAATSNQNEIWYCLIRTSCRLLTVATRPEEPPHERTQRAQPPAAAAAIPTAATPTAGGWPTTNCNPKPAAKVAGAVQGATRVMDNGREWIDLIRTFFWNA